jgi:hypothetical protein
LVKVSGVVRVPYETQCGTQSTLRAVYLHKPDKYVYKVLRSFIFLKLLSGGIVRKTFFFSKSEPVELSRQLVIRIY